MADFDTTMNLVLLHEGGDYTNDPNDNGGPTKWGITLPDLTQGATSADIENLTRDQAKAIYRAKYWLPLRGDEIQSQAIADIFVDIGVARGLSGTTSQMRLALGLNLPPVSWGHLDDVTLSSMNARASDHGSSPVEIEQLAFDFLGDVDLTRIQRVSKDPTQAKWLWGWLRRDRHNLAHAIGLRMEW